MPSAAASSKPSAAQATSLPPNGDLPPNTPENVKQLLNVVEKKIRNLEKRKLKLDTYKLESSNGKELNDDQKLAVLKYDEVVHTLEFARDLQKQFFITVQDLIKMQKKQAKREQMDRQALELQRVRTLLIIQDVLNSMGPENVRDDFLKGQNGATTLTEENLNQLDALYKIVTPTREPEDGSEEPTTSFDEQLTHAAEHLVAILDGKNKEVVGTTYKALRDVFCQINECGYFNKVDRVENAESCNGDGENELVDSEDGKEEYKDAQDDFSNEGQLGEETTYGSQQESAALPGYSTDPVGYQAPTAQHGMSPSTYLAAGQQPVEVPRPQPDNSVFSTFSSSPRHLSESEPVNFLQDSQIDPAIVVAHPAVGFTSPNPGAPHADQAFYENQSNAVPVAAPTQATQAFAQNPMQVPQPGAAEYSHSIPTQTFTNQNFAAIQGYVAPQSASYEQSAPNVGTGSQEPMKAFACSNVNTFDPVSLPAAAETGDDDWKSDTEEQTTSTFSSSDSRGDGGFRGGFSSRGGPRGAPRGGRGGANGYNNDRGRGRGGYGGRGGGDRGGYRGGGSDGDSRGYRGGSEGGYRGVSDNGYYNGGYRGRGGGGSRGAPRGGGGMESGGRGGRGGPRGGNVSGRGNFRQQ